MELTSTCCSHDTYLEAAYAYQNETGGRYVPLFDILKELFKDAIQPDEAATRVSALIFSNDDSISIYSDVLSTIIGAAQGLSETRDLEKLADLVLALSRLLDLRNESSGTLHLYVNLKSYDIAPGQVIEFGDGKIWSDLPSFASDLGDCMRGTLIFSCSTSYHHLILYPGPTAYINDGTPEYIAEQQWTNRNTFTAYLIRNSTNSPSNFAFLYQFAFRVLADALEWDARTVEGMDSLHSLRAALRWTEIAGDELWERIKTKGSARAGHLWLEEWEREGFDERESNAQNSITPARWLWWAARLDELAESNMIDDQSKAMARSCVHKMKRYREG